MCFTYTDDDRCLPPEISTDVSLPKKGGNKKSSSNKTIDSHRESMYEIFTYIY